MFIYCTSTLVAYCLPIEIVPEDRKLETVWFMQSRDRVNFNSTKWRMLQKEVLESLKFLFGYCIAIIKVNNQLWFLYTHLKMWNSYFIKCSINLFLIVLYLCEWASGVITVYMELIYWAHSKFFSLYYLQITLNKVHLLSVVYIVKTKYFSKFKIVISIWFWE